MCKCLADSSVMNSNTQIECFIYDNSKDQQEGPLELKSLELYIFKTSENDLKEVSVWRTGFEDWMPALEYKKHLIQTRRTPPPPPSKKKSDFKEVVPNSNEIKESKIESVQAVPLLLTSLSVPKIENKEIVCPVITSKEESKNKSEAYTPNFTIIQKQPEENFSEVKIPNKPQVEPQLKIEEELPKVKVTQKVISPEEKRLHARYPVRMKCIIRNENITFRTFLKDISLGGLSLENEIPKDIFNSNCSIFITSLDSKENIRFKIKSTQRAELKFFSFENLDAKTFDKLKSWIQEFAQKIKIPA